MSGAGSQSSSESRHMSFYKSALAATIGAGVVFAMLTATSYPAFSQAPPPAVQTAGDENAEDDHSYLPPSMRYPAESAKSPVAITAETQVHAPAKTISMRRAARRRARRESWDYGWGSGRGLARFGN
jgi:hypothetical protein